MVGDAASLPAVNSLLDAVPATPATIWFETTHASDEQLPFRVDPDHHTLRRVPRRDAGAHLVDEVKAALPGLLGEDPSDAYVWEDVDGLVVVQGSDLPAAGDLAREEPEVRGGDAPPDSTGR
ncbi:hypothetical protein ACVWXU_004236 [Streptomyces sp. TE33382]